MLKKIFEVVSWAVLVGIVGLTIYQRWNLKLTEEANRIEVVSLPTFEKIQLPKVSRQPQILFFWATWCPPCKVEMFRLHQSVKAGHIPAQAIHAVSVGEDPQEVLDFIKNHPYEFQYYASPDGAVSHVYQVPGTPTIYHLDPEQKVVWSTVGVHPLSLFKAERLFDPALKATEVSP